MVQKKKKYVAAILVLIVIMICSILIWRAEENRDKTENKKDPRQCVEEKLSIKLEKDIILVEGNAIEDEYGEEHLEAKFSIEKHIIENLREKLGNCLWKYEIEELEEWESQYINRIKKSKMDLSDKEIIDYYQQDREGEEVKTISIEAFIATDSTGEYYLYIFY